jgi:hypothetical protein
MASKRQEGENDSINSIRWESLLRDLIARLCRVCSQLIQENPMSADDLARAKDNFVYGNVSKKEYLERKETVDKLKEARALGARSLWKNHRNKWLDLDDEWEEQPKDIASRSVKAVAWIISQFPNLPNNLKTLSAAMELASNVETLVSRHKRTGCSQHQQDGSQKSSSADIAAAKFISAVKQLSHPELIDALVACNYDEVDRSHRLPGALVRRCSKHVLIIDNIEKICGLISLLDVKCLVGIMMWDLVVVECHANSIHFKELSSPLPVRLTENCDISSAVSSGSDVSVTILTADGCPISDRAAHMVVKLFVREPSNLFYTLLVARKTHPPSDPSREVQNNDPVHHAGDPPDEPKLVKSLTNITHAFPRVKYECTHRLYVPQHHLSYFIQEEAEKNHHCNTAKGLFGFRQVQLVDPSAADDEVVLQDLVSFVCMEKAVPWGTVISSLPVSRTIATQLYDYLLHAMRSLANLTQVSRVPGHIRLKRIIPMCGATTVMRWMAMRRASENKKEVVIFLSESYGATHEIDVTTLIARLDKLKRCDNVVLFCDFYDRHDAFYAKFKGCNVDGLVIVHWDVARSSDHVYLGHPSNDELEKMIIYSQDVLNKMFDVAVAPSSFGAGVRSIAAPSGHRPLLWGVLSLLVSSDTAFSAGRELVASLTDFIMKHADFAYVNKIAGAVLAIMHGCGGDHVPLAYLKRKISATQVTDLSLFHFGEAGAGCAAHGVQLVMPFADLLARCGDAVGFPSAPIARYVLKLLDLLPDEKVSALCHVVSILGDDSQDPLRPTDGSRLLRRILWGVSLGFPSNEHDDNVIINRTEQHKPSAFEILFGSLEPTEQRALSLRVYRHITGSIAKKNYHYIFRHCSLLQVAPIGVTISREDHEDAIALIDSVERLPDIFLVYRALSRRRFIRWCIENCVPLIRERGLLSECLTSFSEGRNAIKDTAKVTVIGPYFQEIGLILSFLYPGSRPCSHGLKFVFSEIGNVQITSDDNESQVVITDSTKTITSAAVNLVEQTGIIQITPDPNLSGYFSHSAKCNTPNITAQFVDRDYWLREMTNFTQVVGRGVSHVVLVNGGSRFGEDHSALFDYARCGGDGQPRLASLWNFFVSRFVRGSVANEVRSSLYLNVVRGFTDVNKPAMTRLMELASEVVQKVRNLGEVAVQRVSIQTAMSYVVWEIVLGVYASLEEHGCCCRPLSACVTVKPISDLLTVAQKFKLIPSLRTVEDVEVFFAVVRHVMSSGKAYDRLANAIFIQWPTSCNPYDSFRKNQHTAAMRYAQLLQKTLKSPDAKCLVIMGEVNSLMGAYFAVASNAGRREPGVTPSYFFYANEQKDVIPVRCFNENRAPCRVGWKPLVLRVECASPNSRSFVVSGTDWLVDCKLGYRRNAVDFSVFHPVMFENFEVGIDATSTATTSPNSADGSEGTFEVDNVRVTGEVTG